MSHLESEFKKRKGSKYTAGKKNGGRDGKEFISGKKKIRKKGRVKPAFKQDARGSLGTINLVKQGKGLRQGGEDTGRDMGGPSD